MKRCLFFDFVKRLFDIVASGCAILAFLPFGLLIALGIKLSSPGPVFYRTVRVGRNRREFSMFKFRSMHVFQPEDPQSGKKSEGGFIANGNRIFRLGGFLRKSKLDELPQLLNVFLGQMSVVGPRPITAKTADRYVGDYRQILDVRPGLSCLDSLFDYTHGELFVKNDEVYKAEVLPVRLELAKIYVERRCLWLDLYCIVRTVLLIFEIAFLQKRTFPYTDYEQEARGKVLALDKVQIGG